MPNKHKMCLIYCEWCGKPTKARVYDRERGRGRFCSSKCVGLWRAQQENFPLRKNQEGDKNPNWRGGQALHKKGYIYRYAPNHLRQHNGYVFEHILVAEQKLGRTLRPGEVVHHNDGNKANNHPDNIEVFPSAAHHTRHHWQIGSYKKVRCTP